MFQREINANTNAMSRGAITVIVFIMAFSFIIPNLLLKNIVKVNIIRWVICVAIMCFVYYGMCVAMAGNDTQKGTVQTKHGHKVHKARKNKKQVSVESTGQTPETKEEATSKAKQQVDTAGQ